MKKRVVTLLLVAAMTGSMVVGCGSNSSSDTKSETKTERSEEEAYRDIGKRASGGCG